MSTDTKQSAGVQELIDRLREEGVTAGQSQADALLTDARKQSMTILDDAKREAEAILAGARTEAEKTRQNGNEALRLASRNVLLKLKESFHEEFENRFRKLVAFELRDRDFLQKLILEIGRRSVPEDTATGMQMLLPADEVTPEELAGLVTDVKEGTLGHFVLGLAADVLREGLTFGVSDEGGAGVRVQLVDDDVEIELTDETVTALLMQYMIPRFRAILEEK
jgi:V/A-type H+-transporting ATPase subunit E